MITQPTVPLPTSVGIVEQYEYEYDEPFILEYEEEIMKPLKTNKLNTTSAFTGKNKTRSYEINGQTITDHHYGIDLVGGTRILAVADGKVIQVVNKGSKGGTMCLIRIQHKDYQSAYYHNKSGSARVKVGDYVEKGQGIANIGNTGKVSGTHLHFQIDKGSKTTAIDPTDYAYGIKELEGLSKSQTIWEENRDYKVLYQKYVRTSPKVSTNKYKWKNLNPNAKAKCDKDKLGYAKYKIGAEINIKAFANDSKGNIWGRTNTLWLCVHDSTGDQVVKI